MFSLAVRRNCKTETKNLHYDLHHTVHRPDVSTTKANACEKAWVLEYEYSGSNYDSAPSIRYPVNHQGKTVKKFITPGIHFNRNPETSGKLDQQFSPQCK